MASVWNKGLYISIFGESYSNAIGVVLDNFPAGIKLNVKNIKKDMAFRAPLKGLAGATKRKETDEFEIVSGIFNGYSTGSPICAIIYNKSFNFSHYNEIKDLIRPSHADYTARIRYNNFNDFRGGGHLSGRLTAPLVFAGSLCKEALKTKKIETFSHIFSVGKIKDYAFDSLNFNFKDLNSIKKKTIAVLNDEIIKEILNEIENAKKQGDSLGGIVEAGVFGLPAGIGSPIFDGLENFIANIIFSIPAVKGLEFGKGFEFSKMKGSVANDEFYIKNGKIKTKTNNNGGILGGISNGMPVILKVVFKPTPTIFKEQNTVNLKLKRNEKILCSGFHDVCIATRGVFVVEAALNVAILSSLIFQGEF